MRPFPAHLPAASLIGPVQPVREPETRGVLISTLSGSASWGGNTQRLGNDTDTALLLGLRQWSDVILVGAQTARAENYGPPAGTLEDEATRLSRGQAPAPTIAVMSRSLDLDPGGRLFSDPHRLPLILTPEASLVDAALGHRRQRLREVGAELVPIGTGSVAEAVATLHHRGLLRISCEGGPGIFAQMVAADLLDLLHVTIEPVATAPVETPLVGLPPGNLAVSQHLVLEHLAATADSSLFLRYRRRG